MRSPLFLFPETTNFYNKGHRETERQRDWQSKQQKISIFCFFSPASLKTPKPSLKAVALKLLKRDDDSRPPSWVAAEVAAEVAAMAPGIVQSASFTQNRKLARYVKTELQDD